MSQDGGGEANMVLYKISKYINFDESICLLESKTHLLNKSDHYFPLLDLLGF